MKKLTTIDKKYAWEEKFRGGKIFEASWKGKV